VVFVHEVGIDWLRCHFPNISVGLVRFLAARRILSGLVWLKQQAE
jgi:hypothetical protein